MVGTYQQVSDTLTAFPDKCTQLCSLEKEQEIEMESFLYSGKLILWLPCRFTQKSLLKYPLHA